MRKLSVCSYLQRWEHEEWIMSGTPGVRMRGLLLCLWLLMDLWTLAKAQDNVIKRCVSKLNRNISRAVKLSAMKSSLVARTRPSWNLWSTRAEWWTCGWWELSLDLPASVSAMQWSLRQKTAGLTRGFMLASNNWVNIIFTDKSSSFTWAELSWALPSHLCRLCLAYRDFALALKTDIFALS